MPYSVQDIAYYLLQRGVVSPDSIVDGDFIAADSSRRNRNLKIIRRFDRGFFTKQLQTADPQGLESFRREASLYWLLLNDPDFSALTPIVPECLGYDAGRQILILELLPEAESLAAANAREHVFAEDLAAKLGAALGRVHGKAGVAMRSSGADSPFPRRPPWILSLSELPIGPSAGVSAGMLQLVQVVQADAFLSHMLRSVRQAWREDGLIHGDLKWDNCLVVGAGAKESGDREIRIVDWELADFGDVAWDIGSVFQAYWTHLILAGRLPGIVTDRARPPPDALAIAARPALQAFWDGYDNERRLAHADARDLLQRSVSCAAARMVQTVYESLTYAPQMTYASRQVLELSLAVYQHPGMMQLALVRS